MYCSSVLLQLLPIRQLAFPLLCCWLPVQVNASTDNVQGRIIQGVNLQLVPSSFRDSGGRHWKRAGLEVGLRAPTGVSGMLMRHLFVYVRHTHRCVDCAMAPVTYRDTHTFMMCLAVSLLFL